MCGGRRQKAGWLLLVVFFLAYSASLWADITLTDEEWAQLQRFTQEIRQENKTLKTQLSDTKIELEKESELRKLQVDGLKTQLTNYSISLTASTNETKSLRMWLGISLGVAIVGLASSGVLLLLK